MKMPRRLVLALAVALCASLAWAGSASAFTQMRISEIHSDGDGIGDNDSDYVELQMYAPNQNFVQSRSLDVYQAGGAPFSSFTFLNDAANGQNQRTILVGAGPTVVGGVAPDYIVGGNLNLIDNDGSVVCFENVDCVAIGFANWLNPPSPFGTAADANGISNGLAPGDTLQRTTARDCPTELDPADDTNNSAADFALGAPTPRRNTTPPTETPCGPGGVPARCGGLRATKAGTNGPNVLRGTPKRDVIAGFGGNDTIRGFGRGDVLCGGKGRDRLIGGKGRDRLLGGPGRDTLRGGPGKDKLRGGPGLDIEIQ
jgi:Ca2+-binding RTX toxin-like protein